MATLRHRTLDALSLRTLGRRRDPEGTATQTRREEDKSPEERSRDVSLTYLQHVFQEAQDICSEKRARIHLGPNFAHRMNIIIQDLELDENGSYSGRYSPCFFDPLQLGAYPIDTQDPDTQRDLANAAKSWHVRLSWRRNDLGDANRVSSKLRWSFHHYARVMPGEDPKPLRQQTEWIHGCLDLDDDLARPIFSSLKWMPQITYKRPIGTGLPHYMITMVHEFPAKEGLLYGELLTITAAMIMRLRNPTFSEHTIMPVMVFSFMGGKKGRILQAHDNMGELVIRKSKIFDFASWEKAKENLEIFVRFMGNTPVGDTRWVERREQQAGVSTAAVQPKRPSVLEKVLGGN